MAATEAPVRTLKVALGERAYPIEIGPGVIQRLAQHVHLFRAGRALVVTNTTVAKLYLSQVTEVLEEAGLDVDTCVLPDGEAFKRLDVLNQIYDVLLEKRHPRNTTLVALGGGVIGDMTGFAAATYQRGVDFVQVPTTLLSQVDSSVGGKTGVNHPLGKNMIGAFHQPRAVVIDTDTLKTLPDREVSAGLAEVVKYGLIADPEFFEWLEARPQALLALDPDTMVEAIYRSCAIKAEVVAEDEREGGRRAILNLGHTFGHAIEAWSGYGNWLHGEAVGCGLVMAADLSARLGWIDEGVVRRARELIRALRLPVLPPEGMMPDDFMRFMSVDKKVLSGQMRLVLLRSLGDAVVTAEFEPGALEATLKAFCRA